MARVRKVVDKKPKKEAKSGRFSSLKEHVKKPLRRAHKAGKKEVYLPLPDNKVGKFLNKRRSIIPKYFRESWVELKLVTWSSRRQTIHLTFAVFVFAIVSGVTVAIVDAGLDRLFKQLLLQ